MEAGQAPPAPGTGNRRFAWLPSKATVAAGSATVVAIAAIALLIYCLSKHDSGTDASLQSKFPLGGPVEFLYLDATRVATYLAQVEGGEVESEKLTQKLTQNLNAKLQLKELGEVGSSQVSELFAEKNVKPTAASSFFALRGALDREEVIHTMHPGFFESVVPREEGDFVEFDTDALLPPAYVNAYLAVLHAGTLAAIFPKSSTRRRESTNFFKKVGATPRAVFALRPYKTTAEAAPNEASASRVAERKSFVYLLPFTASLLSSERSLLKNGGGHFTVLGKLVRLFPEPPEKEDENSYVDSATRETWEQALENAPDELLCRTEPMCAETIRAKQLSAKDRKEAIVESRRHIVETLATQSAIPSRGAVILPIGIYK
jgi:hypothetical protein